ncbi:phosphoenolpyruvate--protein phosphotransferase [Marinobacterium arenosum]|uniref:phosphoenolpyruvate--protein phosphotransferase n=1 Tax=Marinobacterium arenosum TaxID=2862496 RepID=UPI001C93B1A1|nr:phosphoenolpyruvate--protein phosphotransferase [Marinobacterium arenosum]MBY4677760.1 phosphoenolpyruvate--protein phosphotransferase [Marinobacterium arenosum]
MPHSLSAVASLTHALAEAGNAHEAMGTVVSRLKALFQVPVCSLYLRNPDSNQLELVASDGLAADAVGRVAISMEEGVVGLIASSMRPLNLADAPRHDRFIYIPETHEEPYHQFLGAPMIYLRQLVGVLVVQGTEQELFGKDAEALLVTVAAQLAATLYPLQQSGRWKRATGNGGKRYQRHKGIKAASGIGVGRLLPLGLQRSLQQISEEPGQGIDLERASFADASQALNDELQEANDRLSLEGDSELGSLLGIYQMMLASPELQQGVQQGIQQGQSASWALRNTVEQLAGFFQAANDPYLKARQEDIRNIGNRLLQHLCRRENPLDLAGDDELILAGELISITDLASLPTDRVRGLICSQGSALSHTAIVAKALGIAAVMGVEGLDLEAMAGQPVIVDGYRGECISRPNRSLLAEYRRLQAAEQQLNTELQDLKELPALTSDGFQVRLMANTGLLADVSPGLACGAEGIGLYRSEIPFMQLHNFPTEEDQYQVYRQVLEAYAPRPVTMRILDIGGDKQLPYFEINEENPYLGWRGIRFMLDNTSLLVTQLRAMMRASEGNDNLLLLAPMVGRLDELESFRQIAERVRNDLLQEGYQIAELQIGIMIEVPSTLFILPQLAPLLDFVSIGSNDLTQYLLAVDRNNPRVASLFDNLDPAVLRALQQIVQQCRPLGLKLSLCGEMASDPAAALLLLGMGFRQLSLAAQQIPKIKWLIRTVSQAQAADLLERCLQLRNATEVRALAEQTLTELGLDRLVPV